MNSVAPDDSTFEDEEGLRSEISIAIELALADIMDNGNKRFITDIKEEKLAHFAILDLDLPLTYSWYLAGGHTIASADPDRYRPTSTGESSGTIQAHEAQYSDQIRQLRDYYTSREFIPGYKLRQVCFTDTNKFLQDYYRELAPEMYRDLYLTSLSLRDFLHKLTRVVNRESQNKALSEYGISKSNPIVDSSAEEDFRQDISAFHLHLAAVDELNAIKKDVFRATDLIERIVSQLTDMPTTSVEQTLFIANDLPEFFYYFIWKYPALAISADTASGPNADALNRKRLLEFNDFDEQLLLETEALTKQARILELLPELGETISEDSEKSAFLHRLINESVDTRSK